MAYLMTKSLTTEHIKFIRSFKRFRLLQISNAQVIFRVFHLRVWILFVLITHFEIHQLNHYRTLDLAESTAVPEKFRKGKIFFIFTQAFFFYQEITLYISKIIFFFGMHILKEIY